MPRSRSARTWLLAGLAVLSTLLLSGCTTTEIEDKLRFGWPEGITTQADKMHVLWAWAVVAALALGVLVWGMTLWVVIFHRKKSEEIPRQTAYNLPLELVTSAAPLVAIAVLFYFTVVAQNYVLVKDRTPDVSINVTAFKWNWEFNYADTVDSVNGGTVATVGSTAEIPILVLPAGESVKFTLKSNDVIHSFWIPVFNYKLDVIPGPPAAKNANVFIVDLKKGTEGAYVGRCAELCGIYHAQMNFELRVVSPDDYKKYLSEREGGKSTSEALTAINQNPKSQTTKPFNPSRTDVDANG